MMNIKDFEKLCIEFEKKEAELRSVKGKEYATDDVLAAICKIANFIKEPPEKVCMILLLKHIQSLSKAVSEDTTCMWFWEHDGREGLKQRIADARNYLLLLAACLDEKSEYEFWQVVDN